MRTAKLLLVLLCVLAPTVLCRQKRWTKTTSTTGQQDKTAKGKYEGTVQVSSTNYVRARDGPMASSGALMVRRNDRAIDASAGTTDRTSHKPSHRFKNVTIGDGICQSIDIRNNVNYFAILKGCRVIEGFLQIVLIEDNNTFLDVRFPELREITGYLLLYRVNGLKSLSNLFPNLEVIRGDILLTDYAFMVYEMQNLQEIGLKELRKISRGGVRIEKNPLLCYTTNINWTMIVTAGDNFIKDNRNESSCPVCSQCPGGYCWTAQHCQEFEKPKCHEQCLGRCNGTTEADCYVCKHFRHGGKCIERCPSHLYSYLSRRCITKEQCFKMNKVRKSLLKIDDEQQWRPFNGSCITQCPEGYEDENNMTTCGLCEGRCRKVGKGAIIRHISDAQSFRGTTVVAGALEFQIRNGNPNIMNELTDAFGLIEEVTEYIKVIHSFPITSLSFFKKLRVIKGEKLDINNASLVVLDNPNLVALFPPTQNLTIQNGRLFFHYNPKLCLQKIEQLGRMVGITNFTDLEVQPESNGEKVACNTANINITIEDKGSDYAHLKWDCYTPSSGQRLLSYLLNYIETRNENITYEANACGNNTWQIVDVDIPNNNSPHNCTVSKNITGLRPYTQYAVYVKTFTARNENGFSNPVGQSNITFFTTKSDIPSVPTNVVSIPMSDTEILVKWDPPDLPNGPIGYYLISGVIRPDDPDFLETRNYCENGIVEEPDNDDVPEVTVKTPLVSSQPCCSKDIGSKMVSSKKFEIHCRENTTISHIPTGWKNYCVFNKYNAPENISALTSDSHSGESGKQINNNESFLFNVSAPANSYLVKNLTHFSLYTISVAACGVKVDSATQMCSSVQYTNGRTKRRLSADNVKNVRIHVTNNTNLEITWDLVKNPNALTVAYMVEYTNLDVKDAKKSTECLSWRFRRDKHGSHYIKNLSPGNYSLKIRSISLAGDGVFSDTVYFLIGTNGDTPVVLVGFLSFGGLLIVLALVYIIVKTHQRRRTQEKLIANVNPDYMETKYVFDDWEIPREHVEIFGELGLGNFGMVYRGRLIGNVECAVKTVRENANEREKNGFLHEAAVMKNFDTFHIVELLGVVSIGDPPFVIMELMDNGDLRTYLRRIRDTNLVPDESRSIRMAAEIADGMAYLETKKYLHRDLAARNCMVAKNLVVKIGDFGMARDVYETDYYKITNRGMMPIRWMAPENLADGVFTSDSDVWSFGVVIYEILTLGEIPYQGMSNDDVLRHVLGRGLLTVPRHSPEPLIKTMEKCFKWKPNDRPTFMEIVAELEPFLGQDFCEKSYYHSEDAVGLRKLGIKKPYHPPAPIRFPWGGEHAKWVKECEDNVSLLDHAKASTSRGRIFKNGCQHTGNVISTFEDVPLNQLN